jgi:dihydropteroate synthase
VTRVMGILNVTPDSFSDGGQWDSPARAQAQAARMMEEGADVIDIGGQSTRPGFQEVSEAEELSRVVPAIRLIAPATLIPISVDTYRPAVARAALHAGAQWINDVHGLQGDPAMARLVAEAGCPAVLMHCDPNFAAEPGDAIEKLVPYFLRSLAIAASAGIDEGQLILDPGIGFHKTPGQSLEILRRISELRRFGLPLLVGVSRKSVIGHVLGTTTADRLEGTLAATVLAVQQGVDYVRVHDVLANVRAAKMAQAILSSA